MGEFKVWSDSDKNRLYIRFGGFFRGGDAERVIAALHTELQAVKPEFDVITDSSNFLPASPGAISAMRTAAELVRDKGRRRAVRITSGIVTGLMQFKRIMGTVFEEDESVRYASSIAEADAMLDNW